MRWHALLNHRNPSWRWVGGALVTGTVAITLVCIQSGPRPLKPKPVTNLFKGQGLYGQVGTITEQLGQGRFILGYETNYGTEKDHVLQGVHGRLEEPDTLWLMDSPKANNKAGVWVLEGPMQVEARPVGKDQLLGRGTITAKEPALQWEHGMWTGLSTLVWEDLQGQGHGHWILPPGWRRGLDGRFQVERGPIQWLTEDTQATIQKMNAARGWVNLGFTEGQLDNVQAELLDGSIQAKGAEIAPLQIKWMGPIHFTRQDGWRGEAREGVVPRPPAGQAVDQIELAEFKAERRIPDGSETLYAQGVRWTPAGLRLEGNVKWEQPQDGQRLTLRAPRVLMRESPGGTDLPKALPTGESWAEGQAVIAWGRRSLSSPQMEFRHADRRWRMHAPVLGRAEEGTFTAAQGSGSPARWAFEGPVEAQFFDGSSIRGSRLVWEAQTYAFQGQPVTWTRLRQRLSGPRILRNQKELQFPDGLTGALAAQDGDLLMRADKGVLISGDVSLSGHVECDGQGWRLQAERISVTLGQGNVVKKMNATGKVTLRGRLGEGQGESLELDPIGRTVRWQGKVRGLAEMQP